MKIRNFKLISITLMMFGLIGCNGGNSSSNTKMNTQTPVVDDHEESSEDEFESSFKGGDFTLGVLYHLHFQNDTSAELQISNVCDSKLLEDVCSINSASVINANSEIKTHVFNYNKKIKRGHEYVYRTYFNMDGLDRGKNYIQTKVEGLALGSNIIDVSVIINSKRHELLNEPKIRTREPGEYTFSANGVDYVLTAKQSSDHIYSLYGSVANKLVVTLAPKN